jgi:hypothetical protein
MANSGQGKAHTGTRHPSHGGSFHRIKSGS